MPDLSVASSDLPVGVLDVFPTVDQVEMAERLEDAEEKCDPPEEPHRRYPCRLA